MKSLLLVLLTGICLTSTAQNSRWMYLGESSAKAITLVDTLKDDIQQLAYYNAHSNVCILWFNTYSKDTISKVVTNIKCRLAIDTTNLQIKILSSYQYKNGNMIGSSTDYSDWEDVVPESVGEIYLRYAKSLNNPKLRSHFILNALYNPDNQPFGIKP